MRPTVSTVVKSCLQCCIRRPAPSVPSTGNLRAARLAHRRRPFTYVDLYYLGLYNVTIRRQHHKPYMAFVTSLTSRMVHLEVTGIISADSAILAIRRMMARRGSSVEICNDNATTELMRSYKRLPAKPQRERHQHERSTGATSLLVFLS
ncbi:hypothetical protein EVAR_33693_1 [Eumeta japonica]|uniref:Integrase catalytic domain-containing protein n=1 Tax=Eumeta variegata TaxID=151549 RepID=A0A4C1VP20_EUMVA|nr:hypothetical protein EVAR_33693_1 [Eumeta japonica]